MQVYYDKDADLEIRTITNVCWLWFTGTCTRK